MPNFLGCFTCGQKQKAAQTPQILSGQDDCDAIVWQDDGRGYSKKQISKAVAIVLNGYDVTTAANTVDTTCDPSTVELWVQLYRPPFFEDGMVCPPALILWWMKELDRRDKLVQAQAQQQQQSLLLYGPSSQPNPGVFLNMYPPPSQLPKSQQMDTTMGTNYKQLPGFSGSNNRPTTSQQQGIPNTLVINSPGGSQPNVRVIYQDDPTSSAPPPKRISGMGQYNNQIPQQQSTIQNLSQQQYEAVMLQQAQQADQALNALQAQAQAVLLAQNQGRNNSNNPTGRRNGGNNGPPYTIN